MIIKPTTLQFLKTLSRNNDREWFNIHKADYLSAQLNVEQFVDELILKMTTHDQIETISGKKSLYRIYNDIRFSKDKTPYNARFAGYLRRSKPLLRGGYYFWIQPGASRIGCGFAYPNSEDLMWIRQHIAHHYDEWRKLLKSKKLIANFGEMHGDKVRTSPRGFDKDHAAIDLLRYKQFWFEHRFTDNEVLSPNFLAKMNATFKAIRPFFDFMTEILNTDLNGEVRDIKSSRKRGDKN